MAGKSKQGVAPKRKGLDLRSAVDAENLAALERTSGDVIGAAQDVRLAAQRIQETLASPQQRLHRRVRIVVEDAEGAQISSGVFDLKDGCELSATVDASSVSAVVNSITHR